ncbi:MAG: hypothetical protein LBD38_03155 [Streptococcaceae bacterium]|nr:hypothetical protein [Streptococcaceae bacterium]
MLIKKHNCFLIPILFLLGLFLATIFVSPVQAQQNIVLHKVQSESMNTLKDGKKIYPNQTEAQENKPSYFVDQSTGSLMHINDSGEVEEVNDTQPVEGVHFLSYNMTTFFHKIYDELKPQSSGAYTFENKESDKTDPKSAAYDILSQLVHQISLSRIQVPSSPFTKAEASIETANDYYELTATNEYGLTEYQVNKKTDVEGKDQDSVYVLFDDGVYDSSDTKTYTTALPMVVMFPLTEGNEDVHLYPKNKIDQMEKTLLTDCLTSGVSVGDDVLYELKIPIPENFLETMKNSNGDTVWKYNYIQIYDGPSSPLELIQFEDANGNKLMNGNTTLIPGMKIQSIGIWVPDGSIAFRPTGTRVGDSYLATETEKTERQRIFDELGGVITLHARLQVADVLIFETPPEDNVAEFLISNSYDNGIKKITGSDHAPEPRMYSYVFRKVDADLDFKYNGELIHRPLGFDTGVKFKVQKVGGFPDKIPPSQFGLNEDIYFQEYDSGGAWIVSRPGQINYVLDEEGRPVGGTYLNLHVNSQGILMLHGLEKGQYRLIEVESPEGYLLPSNPETLFTVGDNTYEDSDVPGEMDELADNGFHDILNVKRGLLPSTGGTGFLIVAIVGTSLGLATLGLRHAKRRVTSSENDIDI